MLCLQRLVKIRFDLFSLRALSGPDLELSRSLIGKHLQAIDRLAALFFSLRSNFVRRADKQYPSRSFLFEGFLSGEGFRPHGGTLPTDVALIRTSASRVLHSISERADRE